MVFTYNLERTHILLTVISVMIPNKNCYFLSRSGLEAELKNPLRNYKTPKQKEPKSPTNNKPNQAVSFKLVSKPMTEVSKTRTLTSHIHQGGRGNLRQAHNHLRIFSQWADWLTVQASWVPANKMPMRICRQSLREKKYPPTLGIVNLTTAAQQHFLTASRLSSLYQLLERRFSVHCRRNLNKDK